MRQAQAPAPNLKWLQCSAWQINQWVKAFHAQRRKVLEVASEQHQASMLCQCGNGHIGKAGMATLGHGGI